LSGARIVSFVPSGESSSLSTTLSALVAWTILPQRWQRGTPSVPKSSLR